MLVEILGQNVRRQVPKIQEAIESSARAMEDELAGLGPATPHFEDRGALVHEVLRGCYRARAFADELDAASSTRGMGGGGVYTRHLRGETRRRAARHGPRAFYDPKRVRAVVDASDGYQPHLVAPEMGIRGSSSSASTHCAPVAQCVRAVDRVLQNMVERAVERSRKTPSPRGSDGTETSRPR